MSEEQDQEKEKPKLPRTYLTRAFLMPIGKDLYGLFRQMMQHNEAAGIDEKVGKPLGPLRVLRPIRKDEDRSLVRMKTVHPKTGEGIDLVEEDLSS